MGVSLKDIIKDNKKMFLPLGGLLLLVLIAMVSSGQGFNFFDSSLDNLENLNTYSKAEYILESGINYSAIIQTTYGDIEIDLFEDEVPISVNNFVFLSTEDFYDGLLFHRVVKDFVIQGGDPNENNTGDAGYLYSDIVTDRDMKEYSVAMANADNLDTNGSQFFIVCKRADIDSIDGGYTIFGEVTSGYSIVDSICNVSVDNNDRPINNVEIESIQILED